MTAQVTIIDYGMGNLLSVAKAVEHCGAEVRVSSLPDHIKNADYLILPGVGAFADGMSELKKRNLDDAIREFSRTERPFLGICLGMQMMLERSDEFGRHEGLGLIEGSVQAIDSTDFNGLPHKIPHIGWTPLALPASRKDWQESALAPIEPGTSFYFVHSYTAVPLDEKYRLADAYYNGRLLSAAIQSGSLLGCQFHPEKSGRSGLMVLQQFLLKA